MSNAWGIHAGGPRSPFLTAGVIELDRPGVGDLGSVGNDRAAVKRRLLEAYPETKPGTIAAWTGVLLRFAFDPELGDLVIHPERDTRSVSLGRISGTYEYLEPGIHRRTVTWVVRRHPRDDFSKAARQELSTRQAFFVVRRTAPEFEALLG